MTFLYNATKIGITYYFLLQSVYNNNDVNISRSSSPLDKKGFKPGNTFPTQPK